jgi:YidC/Oxa1 family membrane protein insertase
MGGDLMMRLMEIVHGFTGSWGLAIITLTLIVRLMLHPLTKKQMTSMQKMQKLQPRIKMLQEKYKDDKETLNREMMNLYKENKVNPAAGCLPLLVQLPVFILLYRVLTQYDFSGVSFLGIQLDGSVLSTVAQAVGLVIEKEQLGIMSVGYAVMANPMGLMNVGMYLSNALLLGGIGFLTWYQQQLSSSGNPQMAMMNWFMPLFLAFICLSLPGGVLLYWGVSSLLGVIQQIVMSKKTAAEMQRKPTLFKDKPTKSGE